MEGIEDFDGSLRMEEGGWYYILMAMSGDGSFRSLVWKDSDPQNIASYSGDFGSDYANNSWKFIIGSTVPMTLNIAEYHVFTFSGFNK
jgi:hypothetical protein